MNSCRINVVGSRNKVSGVIVRDRRGVVFRQGCGPVISGYWG